MFNRVTSKCFFSTTTAPRIKTFSQIFQQCTNHAAQNPAKQAHCRMIVSGFSPTIFVSNCLIQLYIKCSNLVSANKVFDKMSQRDVVSWNSLLFGYASSGNLSFASSLFEIMPERDLVSWNSLMSGYLHGNDWCRVVSVFVEMGSSGVGFDRRSFAVVLKACSCLEDFDVGVQVHGLGVKMGFDMDVVTGSALVDMYGKCKKLGCSLLVFGEISEKNWVSWSAVIASCVQNCEFVKGFEMFKDMLKTGVEVSQSIYASLFRSCAGLSAYRLGTQLHGHALKMDFGTDLIVGTATLDMYAKSNSMQDAQKLFNKLPNHNLQCYNAIVVGYARSDRGYEGLDLFRSLLASGIGFNEISLSAAFSACAVIQGIVEGAQIHGLAVKSTFISNVCVANAMVDMYGKCGSLVEACHVFDEMERRDAVSWNAIIAAHERNGNENETLSAFAAMLRAAMEPDEFTYGSVLKACAGQQALGYGMEIHNRIIKSRMGLSSYVGSALIHMYCKCGTMEEAKKIHDIIKEEDMVSWNTIISGFSEQKQGENAQMYFYSMLEMGVQPDNFTYATVLDSCGNLAVVGLGKQIHAQIIKQDLLSDVYITSTLVDMYSKCGNMQDSKTVFEKALSRDFVTWNAMICGYAQHGHGEEALNVFDNMVSQKIKPNHATFISVLRACAHIGNVQKGLYYFNSMRNDYGLDPQLEHYSCMVDLLGRSGKVSEALKLIEDMPSEADDVIWRTLLSSCEINGDVEVAEKAATALFQLDPQDSSAYILMIRIYADAGMWDKVSEIRRIMRQNKLKKEPGCSWIEVKDEVHAFLVGDKSHPKYEEMYEKLGLLIEEMKWARYVPDIDFCTVK